jgi:hypothetical protein
MLLDAMFGLPLFFLPLCMVYPVTQITSQTQKWLLLIPIMIHFSCFGLFFKFDSIFDQFGATVMGVIVFN